jgi:hypothetical protein
LLGKIVSDQVWLGPVEGVDGQEGDCLDESYVMLAGEPLVKFAHRGVRRPVETGDKGKFVRRLSTHTPYGSTANRLEKDNRLLEKRTVTNLKGAVSQLNMGSGVHSY